MALGITAAYIPTGRGKKNLILFGYSYQESPPTYWNCSRRKNSGCRATARTNRRGEVIRYQGEHNHDKPRYYQKTSRKMVQL